MENKLLSLFSKFSFIDESKSDGELDFIFYGNCYKSNPVYLVSKSNINYYIQMLISSFRKKTYSISITDFSTFPEDSDRFYHLTSMVDTVSKAKIDNMKVFTFVLPRFEIYRIDKNLQLEDMSNAERWMTYFSKKTSEKEIKELCEIDINISNALQLKNKFFEDEDNTREYEKIEREYYEAYENLNLQNE